MCMLGLKGLKVNYNECFNACSENLCCPLSSESSIFLYFPGMELRKTQQASLLVKMAFCLAAPSKLLA